MSQLSKFKNNNNITCTSGYIESVEIVKIQNSNQNYFSISILQENGKTFKAYIYENDCKITIECARQGTFIGYYHIFNNAEYFHILRFTLKDKYLVDIQNLKVIEAIAIQANLDKKILVRSVPNLSFNKYYDYLQTYRPEVLEAICK